MPDRLLDRFDDTGNGWYDDTDEIDIRPATYEVTITKTGRRHTAISYLAKNSPIAARGPKNFTYRLGGPILRKRAGLSRNIGSAAQRRH